MQNAIAIFEGNGQVVLSNKTQKTGSFARAIAFATREVRTQIASAMYLRWLANGQYRPVVEDILSCGLVPKSALLFVRGQIPENGAIKKEALIALCKSVDYVVRNKRNKEGNPIELKGQKLFVYGVVQRIADENTESTIDA